MTVKVKEIINWVYSDYKDQLVQMHIITATNMDEVFRRVYALERSSRYDSVRRYEFEDASLKPKYDIWKETGVTIEMFYGSATVD